MASCLFNLTTMAMKYLVFLLALPLLVFSCSSPSSNEEQEANADSQTIQQEWVPLFNHENLEGWQILPGGQWNVENGNIVGTSPADEPLHGILLSNQEFGDFKLRVTFKILTGDSGLYFRVEKADDAVSVNGFQAEIDVHNETGGLYETGGREWVVKPDPDNIQQWMKSDDWNELVVIAKGKDVKVFLNGHETAALTNDTGRTKGHIGLQLHGGMEMNVMFKDVLIQENPANMEL